MNSILNHLKLATQYDPQNYKAWHNLGLLNFKYFEILRSTNNKDNSLLNYSFNSLKSFKKSVLISGKNISKTLQNLLRIIDIWFIMGGNDMINDLIQSCINEIDVESWITVIPQLLARVNILDEIIRKSLCMLLKKIAKVHPQVIIYPLIVLSNSKSKIRRQIANIIIDDMITINMNLVEECKLVINELNRCALLLHEKWGKLLKKQQNVISIQRMLKLC